MSVQTASIALNPNVSAMRPSQTLAMTSLAKELSRQGKPVIGLSAGEPDFNTPAPVAEAGIQAIREGFTQYTDNAGMLELREAICSKLKRENGLDYRPEEILCSNGAKQSIAQVVLALCRPDDEVLIPAPFWVSYPEMVILAGAKPVEVQTTVETEYRLTAEKLEASITEHTRMLILCSPSNPTGSVYTPEELEALAEVLRRHEDIIVVSDEIYEHIIFDATHVSFASLPGMRERTVTVNGFSKAYAMTGWRLGYIAAPVGIVKAAGKIQSQVTSAPSSISQRAGIVALEMGLDPIHEMVASFRSRRDFVLEALRSIPEVVCPTPEGAFYVFPQVSSYFGRKAPNGRLIGGSEDLCLYLLEEHNVALVPGEAFGGPDGLRISYASAMPELKEAMRRIKEGFASLREGSAVV